MPALDRAIVVGGGVGGLTVALALPRAGVAVEVHERHPRIQRHATGFTLWSYAIQRVMALGLDEVALAGAGSAIEHTEIRNQGGRADGDDARRRGLPLAGRPELRHVPARSARRRPARLPGVRKARTEDVVRKGRTMGRMAQLHNPIAVWLRDQAFRHMPAAKVERVTRETARGGEQ